MKNIRFEDIQKGNQAVFQELFETLYEDICKYAFLYVNDENIAKELVQEVFIKLWESRKDLSIAGALNSYLFRAVRNRSLNHIRDHKKNERLDDVFEEVENDLLEEFAQFEGMDTEFVQSQIDEAIASLPNKCREIFLLSRKSGLSYSQIAEELEVSKKTVENQMGIALKKLREKLSPVLFLFVWYL